MMGLGEQQVYLHPTSERDLAAKVDSWHLAQTTNCTAHGRNAKQAKLDIHIASDAGHSCYKDVFQKVLCAQIASLSGTQRAGAVPAPPCS